jgi:transcription elongation factor
MKDKQRTITSLKSTEVFLGKESEYHSFSEYIKWSEKIEPKPSVEQIASNTPSWIQLLSPPLRTLHASGYEKGSPLRNSTYVNST